MLKNTSEKIYENDGNEPVIACVESKYKQVLDVGFGNGANARILKERGHVVDGITLSEQEAEVVKGIIRNVYIYNLELGLPTEITENYDAIICSHVLEHIAYPSKLLKDIHDHLNHDGILVVALPNLMNYRFRWELLKGNFHTKASGIWDNTHLRWYTYKTGSELFLDNSFKIKKAWVVGEMPFFTVTKIIPRKIRYMIFGVLAKISKGFFGTQLLYLLKKS